MRSALVLALLLPPLAARGASTAPHPSSGHDPLSVALMPAFTSGPVNPPYQALSTEQMVWQWFGQQPDLDELIQVSTWDEVVDRLWRLVLPPGGEPAAPARHIRQLYIFGHGDPDHPQISLGAKSIEPLMLDAGKLQEQMKESLSNWQELAEARSDDAERIARVKRVTLAYKARLEQLERVSRIMAPGAQVTLLNCSTAATADGKQFVRNLARVFVGRSGGQVLAATNVITVGFMAFGNLQKLHAWWRTGEWKAQGDVYMYADWLRFDTAPDPTLERPLLPWLFVHFDPLVLNIAPGDTRATLELSPNVETTDDSGQLRFAWEGASPAAGGARAVVTLKDRTERVIRVQVSVQDARGRTGQTLLCIVREPAEQDLKVFREDWEEGRPRYLYTYYEEQVPGPEIANSPMAFPLLSRVNHGRFQEFAPDGTVVQDGSFKHGARSGPWIEERGLLRGAYQNGVKQGLWIASYPDGKIRETGQYANGQREGTWTDYHRNGKVNWTGTYQAGVRKGVWKQHDELGRIRASGEFGLLERPGGSREPIQAGTWQYWDYRDALDNTGQAREVKFPN